MPQTFPDPREGMLGEVDLALVHALQVNPRAPWAQIAAVIGVDPGTAARRWATINEQQLAWFGVWPTPERHSARGDAALVRVRGPVRPKTLQGWLREPAVLAADQTSAGLVMVVGGRGGLAELAKNIDRIVDPALMAEIEYAAGIPCEDSLWRLQVLSARQVATLRGEEPAAGVRVPSDDVVDEVTELLREDARMPLSELGPRMGVSDATARRTVERVLAHGLLRLGCDVSMPAVGLGRGVVVRGVVTAGGYAAANAAVLKAPSVHRVLNLLGPASLTVGCRVGSLAEVLELEAAWGDAFTIVDRWTVTMPLKRNGHLLGPDGRSVGQVDVIW